MTTPQTPADTPDAVKENTRRECLKCHTSWSGPGNLPMECPACKSRTVKTGWPKQPTTVPEKHGLSENLIVCVAPNDLKTCPRCGPDACTGNHSDVPDVVAEVEKALAQFDDNDNTEPNCLMDEVPLPVVRWLRALVQRVKAAEDELEAQFRYGYRLGLSRGTNDETEDDVVRLWKHKRVTEQGAFQKTRWGMTNKELCEILHSDVERWLTEEEAEVLREAATRIEQLASAHAQVVAELDAIKARRCENCQHRVVSQETPACELTIVTMSGFGSTIVTCEQLGNTCGSWEVRRG